MKRALLLTLIVLGFYGGLLVFVFVAWNSLQAAIAGLAGMCIVQSLHTYTALEKE